MCPVQACPSFVGKGAVVPPGNDQVDEVDENDDISSRQPDKLDSRKLLYSLYSALSNAIDANG